MRAGRISPAAAEATHGAEHAQPPPRATRAGLPMRTTASYRGATDACGGAAIGAGTVVREVKSAAADASRTARSVGTRAELNGRRCVARQASPRAELGDRPQSINQLLRIIEE
ncbi:hypothetical protein C2845_PM07G27740 [Panicum miliaceum]|uniref:Uncharacterized protein n=1 Tax=Panicum miliaceum TaxID=4540 RepID=A0A3L6SJD1_PANMI|nr:hypothetical protein C2845_PM07G27740 [Panicum miliaceum]